jgi:hypothetical protein
MAPTIRHCAQLWTAAWHVQARKRGSRCTPPPAIILSATPAAVRPATDAHMYGRNVTDKLLTWKQMTRRIGSNLSKECEELENVGGHCHAVSRLDMVTKKHPSSHGIVITTSLMRAYPTGMSNWRAIMEGSQDRRTKVAQLLAK